MWHRRSCAGSACRYPPIWMATPSISGTRSRTNSRRRWPVKEMTRNALTAVVRNSALNLTGQGLYALLQLCSIVVLARALGTAAFGRYYTIFAIILIVQLISEGGLTTILTRRLVRAPD